MNNLTFEMLSAMNPQASRINIGLRQLHWIDDSGAECSITEFNEQDLANAKVMAGHANDIQFAGNFRFSRTI